MTARGYHHRAAVERREKHTRRKMERESWTTNCLPDETRRGVCLYATGEGKYVQAFYIQEEAGREGENAKAIQPVTKLT